MGKLVFIDAGHGGRAPGNVNKGVREADVVLDLATRLGHYIRLLSKEGDITGPTRIQTKFSREIDQNVSIGTRTFQARLAKASLLISLHTNSSLNWAAQGVEAWVCGTGMYIPVSSQLAHEMLDKLHPVGFAVRGVKPDGDNRHGRLGILRGVCWQMPAVLLEVGFASNAHDRKLLAENRNYIARQLALAVCEFFRIEPRLDLVEQ